MHINVDYIYVDVSQFFYFLYVYYNSSTPQNVTEINFETNKCYIGGSRYIIEKLEPAVYSIDFKLYGEDFANMLFVSSNVSDNADEFVKYKNIENDLTIYRKNINTILTGDTAQKASARKDIINVNVYDNTNTFNVSVIATNENVSLNNTNTNKTSRDRITARSQVSVVINNYEMSNTENNQFVYNNVASVLVNNKLYYIANNKLYEQLETLQLFRDPQAELQYYLDNQNNSFD